MQIDLTKMTRVRGVRDLPRFRKAFALALPQTGLDAAAPGILRFILVTRPRIVWLNRLHLGHEGDTDVITYDLRDDLLASLPPEAGEAVAAEIYICPEVALRQAPRFSASPSRELFRYAVHGMLHLAGLDDLTPRDRAAMRRAEARVLAATETQIPLDGLLLPPSTEPYV